MNYQLEIDKYRRMYEATPIGKWMTRRLIAHKIDSLMIERSRGKDVTERFIEEFSYASPNKSEITTSAVRRNKQVQTGSDIYLHFPKPEFKPQPHKPRFAGNTPADNASYQERGGI